MVTVSVVNEGSQAATASVSLTASVGTVTGFSSPTVSLAPGASADVAFLWTAPASGVYSFTGRVAVLPGETDTADNVRTITASVQ